MFFGACLFFSLAWMMLVTGDPELSIKLCTTILFSCAMLLILSNLLLAKDRFPVGIKKFIANNFVTNSYDKDYGENCDLFDWESGKFLWENFSSNFDEFIFYHFFGWTAK
ncbi:MAG: Phosphatidylserine synthase 2, partial [Marteilia pararefringens]